MPSKRFWIVTGVLVAGAGLTAVAAQGYRGHFERGGYHGGGHGFGDEVRGRGRGWWRRGPITKEAYDARTRSRFARIDANGDGIIEGDEAKSMIERRMERRSRRWRGGPRRFVKRVMRRFDVDKDGKVTRAEFDTRIEEFFARADLDGDGQITDADLPPMLRDRGILSGEGQVGRRYGRRGRRGARFLRMLRGADANRDNVITLDEAKAAAAKRFERFDANKDGVVERADLDALKAEAVDYRVRRLIHRYGGSDGKLSKEQFVKYRDERFARLDYNSDGELSRDELPARRWGKRRFWKKWRKEYRDAPHHREEGRRRGEHRGPTGGSGPQKDGPQERRL